MNKFKKCQVLMFFLLAITPLISSSFRSTYLYFISNIIIITLAAEAGLFSVFLKPLEHIKQSPSILQKPLITSETTSEEREASTTIISEHVEKKLKLVENSESEKVVSVTKVAKEQKGPSRPLITSEATYEEREASTTIVSEHVKKKLTLFENSESEKVVSGTKVAKEQKGPSRPSLFFIGGGEYDAEVMEEEIIEAEEEFGGVNGNELFAKAEAFIGLFYKQLKMQREEFSTYEKAL